MPGSLISIEQQLNLSNLSPYSLILSYLDSLVETDTGFDPIQYQLSLVMAAS